MAQHIDILIIEDSPEDADLLVRELRRAQFEPTWRRVDTEAAYLEELRPELDLILSDFRMPQFSGLRALELLNERGYNVPFIIVSGTIGEETAVEAIKQGAADYLLKDRLGRLGAAIRSALEQSRLRREYHLAETAVREGERKFRALFDAANDPIYMIEDGIFIDCNLKGQSIYGRTRDEILGHTPDEFCPPLQPDGRSSREKAIEIIMKATAGEPQFFEWTSLHKNGTSVHSEISLSRLELGGRIYLQAIARDITGRKRAEEQIAEQAALLNKAHDAIIVRDLSGAVLFWNDGAERLYGWSNDEVIGRNIAQFIYQDPAQFMEVNRHILTEGSWSGEIQQLTRDQQELTVQARGTLLVDNEGRPKSVLSINTDITEKKKIEAQFMRAQRMESIGTLAGGIAHDLNNILTPIMMSIGVLKMRITDPEARHILEAIELSSKRGADIVRQVLSFARGLKSERKEIRPESLLKDIESIVGDTFPKSIHLKVSLPPRTWPMLGDATQLHQILLNLCVNARDAMPNGGNLTVAVDNVVLNESCRAIHLLAKPGRYVTFSVRDSGMGISPELVDKIFEPFFTTKDVGKGTGLGLSTVMAICKSHDGFINVTSKPGKGTTFKVYLPSIELMPETQRLPTELTSLPRGHGETILVVDDEASILDVTGRSLEAFGYHTLTAHDGAEAVAIYRQHRNEISVVLTDMALPTMDGAAIIRALSKINPNVKIIASSGFKPSEGGAVPPEPAVKSFLAKPYTAKMLLEALQPVLRS